MFTVKEASCPDIPGSKRTGSTCKIENKVEI